VGIPDDVARDITESEAAATISVHSGPHCDGALVNALDVAGLLRSPHGREGDHSVAQGARLAASALTDFCAQTQGTRQEPDAIGLRTTGVPV
jgi:ketopantoate hydroxymethyltransferase